jgi:putative Holliday junction resolvase
VPQPRARILALDLGTRRIGLAVSDELGLTAQGLPTLQRTNLRNDLEALARVIDQYQVGLVLAGNPLHMSGRESPGTARAREFTQRLRSRTGVEVQLRDERLTTREAARVLRESGVGIRKRAQAVDRLSAVLLLESYLDSLS